MASTQSPVSPQPLLAAALTPVVGEEESAGRAKAAVERVPVPAVNPKAAVAAPSIPFAETLATPTSPGKAGREPTTTAKPPSLSLGGTAGEVVAAAAAAVPLPSAASTAVPPVVSVPAAPLKPNPALAPISAPASETKPISTRHAEAEPATETPTLLSAVTARNDATEHFTAAVTVAAATTTAPITTTATSISPTLPTPTSLESPASPASPASSVTATASVPPSERAESIDAPMDRRAPSGVPDADLILFSPSQAASESSTSGESDMTEEATIPTPASEEAERLEPAPPAAAPPPFVYSPQTRRTGIRIDPADTLTLCVGASKLLKQPAESRDFIIVRFRRKRADSAVAASVSSDASSSTAAPPTPPHHVVVRADDDECRFCGCTIASSIGNVAGGRFAAASHTPRDDGLTDRAEAAYLCRICEGSVPPAPPMNAVELEAHLLEHFQDGTPLCLKRGDHGGPALRSVDECPNAEFCPLWHG